MNLKKFRIALAAAVILMGFGAICENTKNASSNENDGASEDVSVVDGVTYSSDMTRLISYPEDRKDARFIVPQGVSEIAEAAFAGNTKIEDVVLPDGLKSIESQAFAGCKALKINIPKTVDYISDMAFVEGGVYFEVDDENENYSGGDGAIYSKNGEELLFFPYYRRGEYNMPDDVKKMPRLGLGCEMTKFTLGRNVSNFSIGLLSGCRNLEELVLSGAVDEKYFGYKSNSVKMQRDLTGLSKLKKIDLADGSERFAVYDDALYSKDFKHLYIIPLGKKSLELKADVVKFENKFYNDTNEYGQIKISGTSGFYAEKDGVIYNRKYTKIVLFPSKKETYKMPKKVKNADIFMHKAEDFDYFDSDIGDGPWRGADDGLPLKKGISKQSPAINLKKFEVDEKNPYFSAKQGVLYDKKGKTMYAYPAKKSGNFSLPSSVNVIDSGAFAGASRLKRITIPGTVPLFELVFRDCTSLESIEVKEGAIEGFFQFYDGAVLKEVKLPRTISSFDAVLPRGAKIYGYKGTGAADFSSGGFAKKYGYKFKKLGKVTFKISKLNEEYKSSYVKYSWSKVKKAAGYQFFAIKDGKIAVIKNIKDKNRCSYKLKLSSKYIRYGVHIRPYKIRKGKKVFGNAC